MVLRNVAKTDSLEEQRQEINLLAADVNAISTDLSADTSPQLSADLDLNGNNITGATPGISISPTLISSGSYSFVGSGTPGGGNPSGNLEWNGSDNKLYFGDAYLTRSSNGVGWIGSSGTMFLSAANGVTVTNEGATETYFVLNAGSNTALYHNTTAKLTTAATGVEIFGNIAVSGTVDGRDLNTDGGKLDGIETGATADQTGAEIKTAYEGEADTNAFTDAEQTKLSGIEAGATVNAATGGTSGGIGTPADPQYGSVQFRGGSNTLLGDSVFLYETTNNRLTLGKNDYNVGGAPGGTLGTFTVYTDDGSGVWATQIRSDNTEGNGLFLRAGNSDSYYTAYFTGYDENDVHFVVRGDGNVGIGDSNPSANFSVKSSPTSTYEKVEFVRHVRSSSIIGFGGSNGGATKNVSVFLPIQALKGVVVEYNISTNKYNNGNDQHDDYDVWNLKYEGTSVRIVSQETALRIQNGNATTSVSAKTHTVNTNAGSGFDVSFTINGEYDGYLLVSMKGTGVIGAPQITIT